MMEKISFEFVKPKMDSKKAVKIPQNVLEAEPEEPPTYLFLVNILPRQDVYCTGKKA